MEQRQAILTDLIDLVKMDSNLAVGCTEPVAVAYAGAVAGKYVTGNIENIQLIVSKNIYKNGKSVIVPNTGESGLQLAAAVGVVGGDYTKKLLLLEFITKEDLENAKKLLKEDKVSLAYADVSPDVYVNLVVNTDMEKIEVEIKNDHDNVTAVVVNGKKVFSGEKNTGINKTNHMSDITFEDLCQIVDDIPVSELKFLKEGIDCNFKAADTGLKNKNGLNLGTHLSNMKGLSMDPVMETRILTAAAADMRMGGGVCPIMTSGGSGNQGIGVIIPTVIVAKHEEVEEEKMLRALWLANVVNKYVKIYSGKLSGMCGCAIGAGVGAAAGITWMLGGDSTQIAASCNYMFANLAGMLCDGAKDTCSLKLSTCASEAVLSAYLSVGGFAVRPSVGIIGKDIDETIRNVGRLSKEGFKEVDKVVLDIIK